MAHADLSLQTEQTKLPTPNGLVHLSMFHFLINSVTIMLFHGGPTGSPITNGLQRRLAISSVIAIALLQRPRFRPYQQQPGPWWPHPRTRPALAIGLKVESAVSP